MILNKEDSERLLKHMEEDKPNVAAKESLERGREILKSMNNEVFALMPLNLTKGMINAVKENPLTSFEDKEKWHEHLGWLICAYDVIVEHRKNSDS